MQEYELVVKGKLVLPDEVVIGEIGVTDGKIAAVARRRGTLRGREEVDAGGQFVFPGVIDAHVHAFSNPDEGFVPTGYAAAAGGVTTYLEMPFDLPHPVSTLERFQRKREKLEKESVVDVCLWATMAKTGGLDQLEPLARAGAVAFKMSVYETDPYRFPRIPDPELYKALRIIRDTGLVTAFHAENEAIINDLVETYQRENKVYPRAHMETRPPVTETSAVMKLIDFAYWTGAKVHIAHVSHPRTFDLITQFQAQGVAISGETCNTYLLLDVRDLEKYGPKARNNPPLRLPEDVAGLWRHLQEGHVAYVCSDHAPWGRAQKERGDKNIFLAACGMPGLEILAPLMFDHGVNGGRLTPVELARLLSQGPADLYGIPGKGRIAVGYDADFAILDAEREWVIDEGAFRSLAKLSPFHGWKNRGKIVRTIVRGTTVYDGKNILAEPGFGKFVPGAAHQA